MKQSPSIIGPDGYTHRFGGWRKALESFVDRMNQGDSSESQVIEKEKQIFGLIIEKVKPKVKAQKLRVLVEERRGIGLSFRYKILSRDKFKCVKCGASPATNHSCRLHIDHKIPFSKGGKTVLENLQTLCENCNLGKGNRHLE